MNAAAGARNESEWSSNEPGKGEQVPKRDVWSANERKKGEQVPKRDV